MLNEAISKLKAGWIFITSDDDHYVIQNMHTGDELTLTKAEGNMLQAIFGHKLEAFDVRTVLDTRMFYWALTEGVR